MDDQVHRTLYVGGLAEEVTEELLFELFLQAGPLVNVIIKKTMNQETGGNKFAFVIFKHSQSVPYAIQAFQDTRLYGRYLKIRARVESKHNDPAVDTSDPTPIDLQHKVLEFITDNPELIADLKLPNFVPPGSLTGGEGADDDSYDPMSNFSLGYNSGYANSSSGYLDNSTDDGYDPSQPSLQAAPSRRFDSQRDKYPYDTPRGGGRPKVTSQYSAPASLQDRLGFSDPRNAPLTHENFRNDRDAYDRKRKHDSMAPRPPRMPKDSQFRRHAPVQYEGGDREEIYYQQSPRGGYSRGSSHEDQSQASPWRGRGQHGGQRR
jgi:RNA recognition motif-containing protein